MKLVRVVFALLVLSLYFNVPAEAGESDHAGSLYKSAAGGAKATVLFDIEVERAAGQTKVRLKADGAIKDYREVRLKKNVAVGRPDRMYLDIRDVRLAGKIPARQVGTSLSRVRNALRTTGVRVVFDSNLDTLFEYTISEQPDGLLVTIREPSAAPAVIADTLPVDKPAALPEIVIAPAVTTIRPEPNTAGELDLLIVASESPNQIQEWLSGSPDLRTSLQIIKTARPDEVINTSFLVTGMTSDSNGNYAVEVSFTLLDPSGKPVLSERNFAKTSGRAPSAPTFIMADPELAFTLDEFDPVGEYTIIGIVEDLINNKMARTSLRIALEK